MAILRLTYCLLLLSLWATICFGQTPYVFQAQNPIANFAWDENDTTRYEGHYLYEQAYQLIEEMLTDQRALSFSDAVFAVENCFYDGTLNKAEFDAEIARISTGVRRMVFLSDLQAPSLDVALNYCIYLFYTQPCELNHQKPYHYDAYSLIHDGGLEGGLVAHLLKTGTGTCRSLPYLYKIIADNIGAKAYLANAPLHTYIRQQDAEGRWWNFETTTGTYSRSAWIMGHYHVREEAIRSGLYMTNLNAKETIVQCLYDMLCIYEKKTGFYSNEFVRKCYTLGLRYHYADNLQKFRINDMKYQLDKDAWNAGLRSEAEVREHTVFGPRYEQVLHVKDEFYQMGNHELTPEEYQEKYQEALDYLQQKHIPIKP